MSCAVLVALHRTHQRTSDEYVARLNAAEGNVFAPGVAGMGHLLDALKTNLRCLENDLRVHARSNQLTLPRLEG